jgi:hypothetical protein
LLYARDAEPTQGMPLVYRERTYVVPFGTSVDEAELILRRRFAELRDELAHRPKGKLVNLAVFDHRWKGRPLRPPLVTLQWKDWRGEPEVQRPAALSSPPPPGTPERISSSQDVVSPRAAPSQPPPSAGPGAPGTPRRRLATPGPDERLAVAFEALQDLFFLSTPLEGSEFVLDLLSEVVPSEASGIGLYDINSDELRLVALRGPGAEERKGEAIPIGSGLFGAAAIDVDRPLLIDDGPSDPRFDPGIDGRVGIDARTMALVPVHHQGRLMAMIQLINRLHQAQFSKTDANVLAYVGEKFGEFLHEVRLRPQKPTAPRGSRPR